MNLKRHCFQKWWFRSDTKAMNSAFKQKLFSLPFSKKVWESYFMSTKQKFPDLMKTALKGFAVQVADGRETEALSCCPLVSFLSKAHDSKKMNAGAPADLWTWCKQELLSAGNGRKDSKGGMNM